MVFLHIKSLPNLLFSVLCLPGDQSHQFAQPTINLLRVATAGLGRAVFPPWNEGPNFGSYIPTFCPTVALKKDHISVIYKK